MSIWTWLRGLWDGADGVLTRQEAQSAAPYCTGARVRHLYLGERYCQRCHAENPRWKPRDLLAEAREIAAAAEECGQ